MNAFVRRLCLIALVVRFGIAAPFVVGAEETPSRPQRVLLIGQGPDGHPRATHEYNAAAHLMAKLLSRTERLQTIAVSADGEWKEGPELLDGVDAVVVFVSQGAHWIQEDAARLAAFQKLARRGGGLICLHWGMGTQDAKNIKAFVDLFGGCHGGPDRRYKVVDVRTKLVADSHPILRGIEPLDVHEEFYFKLKTPKSTDGFVPLIKVAIEDEDHTVSWAWERPDGGRSFGFTGLHFHDNWKHDAYRRLMTQAVHWVLKRDPAQDGDLVPLSSVDLELPPADTNR